MEIIGGLLILCLILVGLSALVRKVLATWNRFLNDLRGGPAPQPGPRANHVGAGIIYYRTRSGRADYKFRIDPAGDGGYRAYILEQPEYDSRKKDNHATHRLSDSRGHYVCWTKRLDTPEEARKVAAIWADKTEDYILHGRSF